MKHMMRALALSVLMAGSAHAACYADYKAKQDNPLRLHYGVAEVGSCSRGGAQAELSPRLAQRGWTLLQVVGVFGPEGLDARRDRAGQFFLRF